MSEDNDNTEGPKVSTPLDKKKLRIPPSAQVNARIPPSAEVNAPLIRPSAEVSNGALPSAEIKSERPSSKNQEALQVGTKPFEGNPVQNVVRMLIKLLAFYPLIKPLANLIERRLQQTQTSPSVNPSVSSKSETPGASVDPPSNEQTITFTGVSEVPKAPNKQNITFTSVAKAEKQLSQEGPQNTGEEHKFLPGFDDIKEHQKNFGNVLQELKNNQVTPKDIENSTKKPDALQQDTSQNHPNPGS